MDIRKLLIVAVCGVAVTAAGIFGYDQYEAYSLAAVQAQQEADRIAQEEAVKKEEARKDAQAKVDAALAARKVEIDEALKSAFAILWEKRDIDLAQVYKVEIVNVSPAPGVLCAKTIVSVTGRGNVFTFFFVKDGNVDFTVDRLEGKDRMEKCEAAGEPFSSGPSYTTNDDGVKFVQSTKIWM